MGSDLGGGLVEIGVEGAADDGGEAAIFRLGAANDGLLHGKGDGHGAGAAGICLALAARVFWWW